MIYYIIIDTMNTVIYYYVIHSFSLSASARSRNLSIVTLSVTFFVISVRRDILIQNTLCQSGL